MKQLLTKTQLMSLVAEGRVHECFTHSTEGTFDITAMRAQALKTHREIHKIDIAPHITEFLLSNHVWDDERVRYWIGSPLYEWEPAILVLYPGNHHIVADGVHRLIARARMEKEIQGTPGYPVFSAPFWVFEKEEIIRPGPEWVDNPLYDWGDDVVDGKIVRRT